MSARSRAGFTLIEIMLSMVIFSTVVLALVGVSFQIGKRSLQATDQSLISAAMIAEVDRATTISYDSLRRLRRCSTDQAGNAQVTTCTSVTAVTNLTSDIQIVLRTNVAGGRPDTITFRRGKLRSAIPTK